MLPGLTQSACFHHSLPVGGLTLFAGLQGDLNVYFQLKYRTNFNVVHHELVVNGLS